MKTLKLSSMLLVCLVLLFSCKKDPSLSTEQNSLELSGQYGVNGNGNGNGNGNLVAQDVAPTMTVLYNPDPAVQGQVVSVTGKFTPADGETAPSCGKLRIQENVDGIWTDRGEQVNVNGPSSEVTYQFIPTETGTGVYEFRVHYVAANCTGYQQNKSDGFLLDVISACSFNITGSVEGLPVFNEPGFYQFTVTYVVNTCDLVFDKLKTQGGLTNGSSLISTSGGTNHIPGSSTNQIIKWEENTPGIAIENGVKTYTIVFKKAYSGTGPITVTGNWSASASMNGVSVGNAEFAPIVFEQ